MGYSYSNGNVGNDGTDGTDGNNGSESTRKMPSYSKFIKKMYKDLHAKYPNDTAADIMKKISVEWNKQAHNWAASSASASTRSRM